MSGNFDFASNDFNEALVFDWRQATTGDATGLINNTAEYAAVTGPQLIDPAFDVDKFAIMLVAGQTVTFDVDQGAGDSSPVDAEIAVADTTGSRAGSGDDGVALDPGSTRKPPSRRTISCSVDVGGLAG